LERYEIALPINSILVGDPMYLINMSTKKSTTSYIADFKKLPNNRKSGIIVLSNEGEFLTKNRIIIYSMKDIPASDTILKMHENEGYFQQILQEHRYLKNDKGKLVIKINNNKIVIPVDIGDCGHIYTYQKKLGYIIEITTEDLGSRFLVYKQLIEEKFKKGE